jgi:hypothetical protein
MRKWKALGPVTLAAGVAWLAVGVAASQPPAPTNDGLLSGRVEGVGECQICHSGAKERGLRAYVNSPIQSHEFCRLDESVTWEEQDPHSRAFAVLRTDAGKAMSAKLKYDVTAAPQCLSCHATDKHARGAKLSIDEQFIRGDKVGVGCVACHDGSDPAVKKAWRGEHYEIKSSGVEWRTYDPDKKAAAGMRNLRDPVIKANLCASCHVGNPAEGKVITHEMYVAGHPPLPPFELLTFAEDEPRHWGTPHEMPYLKGLDATAAKRFSFDPADGEAGYALRHLAAGAVAALKAEMLVMKMNADAAAPPPSLDYARLDCYACHHPLTLPSARQNRGYAADPGRPPPKAWVGALAGVVADRAGENAFEGHWNELIASVSAVPYGDAKRVSAAAGQLIAWCEGFEKTIPTHAALGKDGAKPMSEALAKRMTAAHATADPEAALALAWAYRSLHKPATGKAFPDAAAKAFPIRVRETFTANGQPVTAGAVGPGRLSLMYRIDSKRVAAFLGLNE